MSQTVTILDAELLGMLASRGYTIKVTQEGDSKHVDFLSRYSDPFRAPISYTTAWPDAAIRRDQLHRLLRWAELRLVVSLA